MIIIPTSLYLFGMLFTLLINSHLLVRINYSRDMGNCEIVIVTPVILVFAIVWPIFLPIELIILCIGFYLKW